MFISCEVPRYFTCVFRGIYWPLILKFKCFVMFLLDLGLNSETLVLLVFKDILFPLSYVLRSFKWWLIRLFIFFKELSTSSKLISCAKWCTLLNFMPRFRSLMYIRKSSGPRAEPYGTPKSTKALSDFWSLTVTYSFILSAFLKTGMTLANFSRFWKVPSENEKLMSLTRCFERTEHESLSILVGIL